MAKLSILSPWAVYFHKLEALFGDDPEVKLVFDNDAPSVKLYVDSETKANALEALLPHEVTFGSVVMTITVIPANGVTKMSLLRDAFNGNPAFSFAETSYAMDTNPVHYFVFKNKVVQYHNDDLGDYFGNCSTLYQELAKELIGESEGVHFCTDLPEDVN